MWSMEFGVRKKDGFTFFLFWKLSLTWNYQRAASPLPESYLKGCNYISWQCEHMLTVYWKEGSPYVMYYLLEQPIFSEQKWMLLLERRPCENRNQPFVLSRLNNSHCLIRPHLFLLSSYDGHLRYFHFLATLNNAMNRYCAFIWVLEKDEFCTNENEQLKCKSPFM